MIRALRCALVVLLLGLVTLVPSLAFAAYTCADLAADTGPGGRWHCDGVLSGGNYYECRMSSVNGGAGTRVERRYRPSYSQDWSAWAVMADYSCPYSEPPPPPTCTAGTEHAGLWPPTGATTVSVGGCCAKAYMNFDNGTNGVEETGALCPETTDTPAPVDTSQPPPMAVTCQADGTCTYCDVDNTGVCVEGQPPPNVSSSGGNPPPATSSPTPPPSSGGDPVSSSSTGSGSGSGSGSGGTGTGSGGSMTGTGNPTPQPGDNGDWPSDPAHATSSGCTAGDACNAGQASGVVGQLYQPGSATVGSLYAGFKSQVSQAPLLQAGKNFFVVNASGTCPTWHIPGNKYWGEAGFDFAFFCDPAILDILAAAGWVVLALGAFSAFRVAIY